MENHSVVKLEGFSRVQIEEDGRIVGDSGFVGPNQITNDGVLNYIVDALGSSNTRKYVSYVALGTGGAPASNATALAGEITSSTKREAVTFANVASTTAQFTATFASSDSFLAGTSNLSNIGLFASSAANALFAGNTYTSSSCATNQNVNVTYQIRFTR